MAWFKRVRTSSKAQREAREIAPALFAHLDDFVTTRKGVEAWVEAPTSFNQPSILLIAHDGESTRRAVPSVSFAHQFAVDHAIPSYDAGVMPYPKRMRDYDLQRRPKKDGPKLA